MLILIKLSSTKQLYSTTTKQIKKKNGELLEEEGKETEHRCTQLMNGTVKVKLNKPTMHYTNALSIKIIINKFTFYKLKIYSNANKITRRYSIIQ